MCVCVCVYVCVYVCVCVCVCMCVCVCQIEMVKRSIGDLLVEMQKGRDMYSGDIQKLHENMVCIKLLN